MTAQTSLGKCVAEYRSSASGFVKLAAIGLASLAVGGGMISLSVATDDSNVVGRVIMFILGVLFLLPAALAVYGLAKGRKNAIRIHENGIVLHKAGDDYEVTFDSVDAYADGLFLVITTREGHSIEFGLDGLANAADLFSRLREEVVVKRLVPELKRQLARGEAAEFGGVESDVAPLPADDGGGYALDANGITVAASQRRLAWSEIVECGSMARELTGSGKLARTLTCVVLKTKTETIQAAVDPLSDREILLALCAGTIPTRVDP